MLQKLGSIDTDDFLANYWQKQPMLIRRLYPDIQCPVDANDLAGLALEEEVESRIVYRELDGLPWQLQQGPFTEQVLNNLPAKNWTLLIQGLDHWVPECADLLDDFRFLPNWRIDDLMASFAPEGGSVGPHYDFYDVFLLQMQGRRRWQVGPLCDADSARLTGTPLRILADMPVTEEWVLEPGDCLYLPPQVAHYGEALDRCMTFSIGFRSPRYDELLSSLADTLCDSAANQRHLADGISKQQTNPGEIQRSLIDYLQNRIIDQLTDSEFLAEWFSNFVTGPKNTSIVMPLEETDHVTINDLREALQSTGSQWRWNEGSRYTYVMPATPGAKLVFSVDGESIDFTEADLPWIRLLCAGNRVDSMTLRELTQSKQQLETLVQLVNKGSLLLIKDSGLNQDSGHN